MDMLEHKWTEEGVDELIQTWKKCYSKKYIGHLRNVPPSVIDLDGLLLVINRGVSRCTNSGFKKTLPMYITPH